MIINNLFSSFYFILLYFNFYIRPFLMVLFFIFYVFIKSSFIVFFNYINLILSIRIFINFFKFSLRLFRFIIFIYIYSYFYCSGEVFKVVTSSIGFRIRSKEMEGNKEKHISPRLVLKIEDLEESPHFKDFYFHDDESTCVESRFLDFPGQHSLDMEKFPDKYKDWKDLSPLAAYKGKENYSCKVHRIPFRYRRIRDFDLDYVKRECFFFWLLLSSGQGWYEYKYRNCGVSKTRSVSENYYFLVSEFPNDDPVIDFYISNLPKKKENKSLTKRNKKVEEGYINAEGIYVELEKKVDISTKPKKSGVVLDDLGNFLYDISAHVIEEEGVSYRKNFAMFITRHYSLGIRNSIIFNLRKYSSWMSRLFIFNLFNINGSNLISVKSTFDFISKNYNLQSGYFHSSELIGVKRLSQIWRSRHLKLSRVIVYKKNPPIYETYK